MTTRPQLSCAPCGTRYSLAELAWRCGECGGVLDLAGFTPRLPTRSVLRSRAPSLWRYAEALPIGGASAVSMGEGMTPLLTAPGWPEVSLKVDYLMPTGSFKDRGAVLLAALAADLAVPRMIADSSGNAGTAIAAYAARAGVPCEVYVPTATPATKVAQLRAYGAEVRQVAGSREDTAEAAARAADQPGVFYASHVYHPVFVHGTKTYAFELWDQLDGHLPNTLVFPVGNGTLLLGAYLGCRELLRQRLIGRLPAIVGVQAANCAPLAKAVQERSPTPSASPNAATLAEGIAIARPARGTQILSAIAETQGTIVTVTEEQIGRAHASLARSGLYVEPTSAVCWAAVENGLVPEPDRTAPLPHTVVPLSGSGLKAAPPGT